VVTTPRQVVAAVVDPEIRVVTIEDLGILRAVEHDEGTGRVTVTIMPTYSGCPAMDVIRSDIRLALTRAGYDDPEITTVLRPAWSTDMITAQGRAKLAAAGIAPPHTGGPVALGLPSPRPSCPRCGSVDTEEISRFGSTACRALWRCRACAEPFDHVKAL
jgi:ring-1,2-phenylacetyl-CoA epoxidase subunit PaaD